MGDTSYSSGEYVPNPKSKVLLLASSGAEAERIAGFCRRLFRDCTVLHGNWGEALPAAAKAWNGDLILSYCSRWIVPEYLIARSQLALNFHPAPPEYPGIGGLNWAIYEKKAEFGVTCHEMNAKVDSGRIHEVRRFPLLENDDVEELFRRTHLHLECLAYDVVGRLYSGRWGSLGCERWSPVARRRKELDGMMRITRDMPDDEISLRKRAFEFQSWKLEYAD